MSRGGSSRLESITGKSQKGKNVPQMPKLTAQFREFVYGVFVDLDVELVQPLGISPATLLPTSPQRRKDGWGPW